MPSRPPQDNDPIILGVADVTNRTPAPHEPLVLISSAISAALSDARPSSPQALISAVSHLTIVKPWTWPYADLPGLVAERTGMGPGVERMETGHGGNSPVKALDEACRGIAAGDEGVWVCAGGEALGSLTSHFKTHSTAPKDWTSPSIPMKEAFSPTTRALPDDIGGRHALGAPVQIYPLYETGFRAARGQGRRENHAESAALYGDFAKVAEGNRFAAAYGREALTRERIGRVDGGNRMICYPYPLLMNAFNNVNLAAAVVVASVKTARKLGVPEDKWTYVLGAAGTSESDEFWNRESFSHSQAISASIDAAIESSGLAPGAEELGMLDIYSCFPIVPKLAAHHLSLPPGTPLTVLGGLTSFGGAGNNYSMHALTELTRRLRAAAPPTNALVLANGGVLTHQHAAVLSSAPRKTGSYPTEALLPEHVGRGPEIAETADGEAQVETFTVDFERSGSPGMGHVLGRLRDGRRFVANARDEAVVRELLDEDGPEVVGRWGWVRSDGRRNLFWFGEEKGRL